MRYVPYTRCKATLVVAIATDQLLVESCRYVTWSICPVRVQGSRVQRPQTDARSGQPEACREAPRKSARSAQCRPAHNEGHGRRLTAAFEALENFPALAESRKRVLRVVTQDQPSVAEMVTAIESDVALVIAVMRVANKHATSRGKVRSIPQAIDVLKPAGVEALIGTTKTFDFFERTPVWDVAPERIRLHAVATQRAADRLCTRVEFPERDELLISSLLHDIGKLVLVQAYPGYPAQIHKTARTRSSACTQSGASSESTTPWSAA